MAWVIGIGIFLFILFVFPRAMVGLIVLCVVAIGVGLLWTEVTNNERAGLSIDLATMPKDDLAYFCEAVASFLWEQADAIGDEALSEFAWSWVDTLTDYTYATIPENQYDNEAAFAGGLTAARMDYRELQSVMDGCAREWNRR